MKKLILIMALMGSCVTASAGEGNEGGGGGKGFICKENGVEKMYLADTYELQKSGAFDRYVGHDSLSFEAAMEIVDRKMPAKAFPHPYVKGQKVTLGFILSHIHNGLYFEQYSNQPVPEFNDDNIKAVPAGCRKVQVALQNLKTGVIQVRKEAPYMRGADWFYLALHETLIAMRNKPGYDTTEIREKVKALAAILSNPKNFSLAVLEELAKPHNPNIKIVPQKEQTRFRTLYYAPRELGCDVTWVGKRESFREVKFNTPTHIKLFRTSGDGRVGEHNAYSMVMTIPTLGGLVKRTKVVKATESDFYTESYNAFGEKDGLGTFSLSAKFMPLKTTEMDLGITDYDSVTGEYLGSFEVDDTESIRVVGLDGGFGLRCWTSERAIFRVDERSSVYGEHFGPGSN